MRVSRRLRPRAHDADLLPEQRVQQRRLADVRAADQRREPAVREFLVRGCGQCLRRSSIRSPVRDSRSSTCCAARLFRATAARSLPEFAQAEFLDLAARDEPVLVRLAAHRRPPHMPGSGSPRACSNSCRRVFGSLSSRASGSPAEAFGEQAFDHATRPRRARRRGRPRRTVPRARRPGSSRAAKPPVFSSPLPSFSRSPRPRLGGDLGQRLPAHQRRRGSGSSRPRPHPDSVEERALPRRS